MKQQNPQSNKKQEFLDISTTEPLWTVEDVAGYLRLKEETVRMMARAKKIPALKVGKAWRFKAREIKEMLKAGTGLQ